jgi:FKBP-type peptidyl-prolyl cis-trans isomerase 2
VEHLPHKITIAIVFLMLFTGMVLIWQQIVAADHSRVATGSSVTILYEISTPGSTGSIVSIVRDVGKFVQGHHQLLPALERVVDGMKVGEEKRVKLTADEGFGPYDATKQKTVSRVELPTGVREGDMIEDQAGRPATVRELSDNSAVLDFNHPLAGKVLIVQIRILRVQNPS